VWLRSYPTTHKAAVVVEQSNYHNLDKEEQVRADKPKPERRTLL
jgi:hypothetical protein